MRSLRSSVPRGAHYVITTVRLTNRGASDDGTFIGQKVVVHEFVAHSNFGPTPWKGSRVAHVCAAGRKSGTLGF